MGSLLQRWVPGLQETSARCQLICLHELMKDRELANVADHAWWSLSRACHYHPYELAPTAGELRQWINSVGSFVQRADAIMGS